MACVASLNRLRAALTCSCVLYFNESALACSFGLGDLPGLCDLQAEESSDLYRRLVNCPLLLLEPPLLDSCLLPQKRLRFGAYFSALDLINFYLSLMISFTIVWWCSASKSTSPTKLRLVSYLYSSFWLTSTLTTASFLSWSLGMSLIPLFLELITDCFLLSLLLEMLGRIRSQACLTWEFLMDLKDCLSCAFSLLLVIKTFSSYWSSIW